MRALPEEIYLIALKFQKKKNLNKIFFVLRKRKNEKEK